jgi:hypothetical protein
LAPVCRKPEALKNCRSLTVEVRPLRIKDH